MPTGHASARPLVDALTGAVFTVILRHMKYSTDTPSDNCRRTMQSFSDRLMRILLRSESLADANQILSPYRLQALLTMLSHWMDDSMRQSVLSALRPECPPVRTEADGWSGAAYVSPMPPEWDDQCTLVPQLEQRAFLWLSRNAQPRADALAEVRELFQLSASCIDFTKHEAQGQINRAVSEATHGLIPSLNLDLTPATRMVMADTLYFKARWEKEFDEELTQQACFHGAAGDTQVMMMCDENLRSYAETPLGQHVQLDYKCVSLNGREVVMRIHLPKPGIALADMWQLVASAGAPMEWGEREVQLVMPRFEMECETDLQRILSLLGLSDMLSSADLLPHLLKGGMMQDIVQRARLKVDEGGTEAAAVTYMVEAGCCPCEEEYPQTVEMVVNRPFLFEVVEISTEARLFAGVVRNLDA